MLITCRARPGSHDGDPRDAGIVGVAHSLDLDAWQISQPASAPGAGFAHLEVLQPFTWEGRSFVMFSCDTAHLAGERAARGERGGVWVAPADGDRFAIEQARLLIDERIYAGRLATLRDGTPVLMGFHNTPTAGGFGGEVSDPIPLITNADGWPCVDAEAAPSN
jgi:beta-fructofuranosidase